MYICIYVYICIYMYIYIYIYTGCTVSPVWFAVGVTDVYSYGFSSVSKLAKDLDLNTYASQHFLVSSKLTQRGPAACSITTTLEVEHRLKIHQGPCTPGIFLSTSSEGLPKCVLSGLDLDSEMC